MSHAFIRKIRAELEKLQELERLYEMGIVKRKQYSLVSPWARNRGGITIRKIRAG